MKIKEVRIENFGKFSNYNKQFSEGLTTINEENGWGKSTLAAFIRVMMFGFDGENKRSDIDKERKRLKPWQGGTYGGSLIIAVGEKEYRITRLFGNTEKDDEFRLYDNKTGLESNDYSEKIGEEIFKIDSDSFKKTIMFSQNDIETSATDGINAKLGNLSGSTDDIDNYEAVADKFKKKLNAMSHSRSTGQLYALRNELTGLEDETRKIPDIKTAIEAKQKSLENLRKLLENKKRESEDLSEELKEASLRAQLLSKREQYENILKRYYERKNDKERAGRTFRNDVSDEQINRLINDYAEAKSKKEALLSKQQFLNNLEQQIKENRRKAKTGKALIIAGIILIALGVLAYALTGIKALAAISAIGLILLITGIVLISGTSKTMRQDAGVSLYNRVTEEIREEKSFIKDTDSRIKSFMEDCGVCYDDANVIKDLTDIKRNLDTYRRAEQELAAIEKEKTDFENRNDITKIKEAGINSNIRTVDEINTAMNEISTVTEKIMDDINSENNQLQLLLENLDELNAKEEQLNDKKEEYTALFKREKLITQTKDLLEKAKASFVSKYSEPVARGFRKYYEMLDGVTGKEYCFDANMNLKVDDHGDLRNSRLYSAGSRDKIDLCFRMGLIDAMYQDEKPVIIMDDPFVNFDDKRLSGGKNIIELLAGEYQIIYLTCHDSRDIVQKVRNE